MIFFAAECAGKGVLPNCNLILFSVDVRSDYAFIVFSAFSGDASSENILIFPQLYVVVRTNTMKRHARLTVP